MKKIFMFSLGCAKNLVDAEIALGSILSNNIALAVSPEDADLILVNTCGFIEPARKESRSAIEEMLALRKKNRKCQVRVVAMGCLAQKEAETLAGEYPELDAVWGLGIGESLADKVGKILSRCDSSVTSAKEGMEKTAGLILAPTVNDGPRLVSTLPAFAYLRLSDGCDNRCNYCSIPNIRGGLKSRQPEAVLEEAETLEQEGARELTIIAQDTTAYGMDLGLKNGLASLLTNILKRTSIPRLRLLYAHPAHIDNPTIDLLASEPRLCRYLDLPLQHATDSMLKAMGRGYGRDRVDALLARFAAIDDFTLRTTFLMGFPGETEADFLAAVALVESGVFRQLGAFAYSPEQDVPAAALSGTIPLAEAEKRRDAILAAQAKTAFAWLDSRVGGNEEVLLEEDPYNGWARGRTRHEAPDADGAVFVQGRDLAAGKIALACIIEREGYDLFADAVERQPGGKPARGGNSGQKKRLRA